MNGIKIYLEYKPFTNGFVEVLNRLHDYRTDGYLSVIELLDDQIRACHAKLKAKELRMKIQSF